MPATNMSPETVDPLGPVFTEDADVSWLDAAVEFLMDAQRVLDVVNLATTITRMNVGTRVFAGAGIDG